LGSFTPRLSPAVVKKDPKSGSPRSTTGDRQAAGYLKTFRFIPRGKVAFFFAPIAPAAAFPVAIHRGCIAGAELRLVGRPSSKPAVQCFPRHRSKLIYYAALASRFFCPFCFFEDFYAPKKHLPFDDSQLRRVVLVNISNGTPESKWLVVNQARIQLGWEEAEEEDVEDESQLSAYGEETLKMVRNSASGPLQIKDASNGGSQTESASNDLYRKNALALDSKIEDILTRVDETHSMSVRAIVLFLCAFFYRARSFWSSSR
jgi:hypothetical protein